MTTSMLSIRVIATVPGTEAEIRSGLLTWISVEINGALHLNGLTLRRSVAGNMSISFPHRVDGRGNRHTLVQPVDDDAKRRIESAIFEQLGVAQPTREPTP